MATRRGACYVVTTERVYKGKTYRTHLLRRTDGEGKKISNVMLANLSHLPEHLVSVPDSPVAGAFRDLAGQVAACLSKLAEGVAPAHTPIMPGPIEWK